MNSVEIVAEMCVAVASVDGWTSFDLCVASFFNMAVAQSLLIIFGSHSCNVDVTLLAYYLSNIIVRLGSKTNEEERGTVPDEER